MANTFPISPLNQLASSRFGGKTYGNEYLKTVDNNRTLLAKNNANRLHLIMINEGIYDVRVSIDPAITASSGFVLAANGGVLTFDWSEDGEVVGYEFFGISPSISSVVRVREVLRE